MRRVFKVVALITRRQDISSDEFDRHWREEHPRYVRELPGLRGYVQTPAFEHRRQWPCDGMAELYFDSVGAIARAFDSPAAGPMQEDEKRFIARIEWFIVDEDERREIEI
jgi:uncharacterized protein (TIGR02118 family)